MCIFFHDWKIVAAIKKYHGEGCYQVNGFEIQEQCTSCKKIKYGEIWDYDKHKSKMIEANMLFQFN